MNINEDDILDIFFGSGRSFDRKMDKLLKQAEQAEKEKLKKQGLYPQEIFAREILTEHEKHMFWILRSVLPEYFIFCQVSFDEILKSNEQAVRSRYKQKRADFVICDDKFRIKCIIELDDRSHDGREQKDAERDAMLQEAGYTVLRYRGVPTREKLRADIENL